MSRRGARPIEDQLRLLLAVTDALSREGSVIDVKGVSYVLGITDEEAADVIEDVMEAALGADVSTGVVLPLEGDGVRGLRLMGGVEPLRALRMTRSEAQAMAEILDGLGVDGESLGGLRPRIEEALFPIGDPSDGSDANGSRERGRSGALGTKDPGAEESAAKASATDLAKHLVICLDALYGHRGLAFSYLGERGVSTKRVVEPLSVRYLFGQWVLDALDLSGDGAGAEPSVLNADDATTPKEPVSRETLQQEAGEQDADRRLLDHRRFFLAGRLRAIEPVDLPRTHPTLRNLPWDEGGQWVRLYFTDRSRYDGSSAWTWSREVPRGRLRAWEKRRIDPNGCAVDVRLFPGSPYLARLVVACAGTCTTDDPALLADIRAYLATLP